VAGNCARVATGSASKHAIAINSLLNFFFMLLLSLLVLRISVGWQNRHKLVRFRIAMKAS
jgi:hypothetical protein